MAASDNSLARVQPFFEHLFARDASGRTWLPALLRAAPHGAARMGESLATPGTLLTPLAVRGASGRLACFDYPTAPSRELLCWFIAHPGELTWPADAELSSETLRLRRVLLYDDPPGARTRAQERALELIKTRTSLSREWWRFEELATLDCVLITDRLVITIEATGTEPLAPATDWYPKRSRLVRNLEAAKQLAQGKRWASLLLSDQALVEGSEDHLASVLATSAPHLDKTAREELRDGYLGNLTWKSACEAVGLPSPSGP